MLSFIQLTRQIDISYQIYIKLSTRCFSSKFRLRPIPVTEITINHPPSMVNKKAKLYTHDSLCNMYHNQTSVWYQEEKLN